MGQPEVPLRKKKFRHVTIDGKISTLAEHAVVVGNAFNAEQTRLQKHKIREPEAAGETGSTGSRKPEVTKEEPWKLHTFGLTCSCKKFSFPNR